MLQLYPHNQQAYDNAKFVFETENRTAIVHATGTGKSLIIAKFIIENPNKKFLFISPNIFIHREIIKHIKGLSKKVDFQTYQYFMFNQVTNFIGYDFIFFDEFHRAGAEEWNKQINELIIQNPNAKILGTSATHIRYLDQRRNMADELFCGNISSYLSLGEAIEKGIHKKPMYISALYNITEVIIETEHRLNRNNKTKELENLKSRKVVWEKANGIDFIIFKHLSINRKKILVFCKSVEHINFIKDLVVPIFTKFYNNNIEFNTIHSYNNTKNNKIFSHFEKSNIPQVIFCVDMLNEGIHIKGVDTVMMFRDTASPIIYFQQIGRCFAVGQNQAPLIFDFVNNFNIKNSVGTIIQSFYNNFNDENQKNYYKKRNLIIDFFDETLDFQNFIKDFDHFKTWETSFSELKEFVKQNNRLPLKNEFRWHFEQKRAYKNYKLSAEQIEMLLQIDENIFEGKKLKTWETSYSELKEFVKQNNRLPLKNEFRWIDLQKTAYKNNKLSAEQIEMLLQIDENIFGEESDWEKKYEKLKEFVLQNNRLPLRSEFRWIDLQKTAYKNNKLSAEQIELLLQIDENIFSIKKLQTWETSFSELKEFIKEKKRFPFYSENRWLGRQKTAYKNNKLSAEQIELLLQIDENIFENK